MLDDGVIQSVGSVHAGVLKKYGAELEVINAHGAWVTPGIVDTHSHMGDDAAPGLNGSDDTNSVKGNQPPGTRFIHS